MSFLTMEQHRAELLLSNPEPSSPAISKQKSQSSLSGPNLSSNVETGESSTTPHRRGQKTEDDILSPRPDDNPLIDLSPANSNIASQQTSETVEYIIDPSLNLTTEQAESGALIVSDVPIQDLSTVSVTQLPRIHVDEVRGMPAPTPQVLASTGVRENITASNNPHIELTVQPAATGESGPRNLTMQPNAVPGNSINGNIALPVPPDVAPPNQEGLSYSDDSVNLRQVESAVQQPYFAESSNPNGEQLLHVTAQRMEGPAMTNSMATGQQSRHTDPSISHTAAQALSSQRDVQISQSVRTQDFDAAKADVADRELLATPRISGTVSGKALSDNAPPALLNRQQDNGNSILYVGRSVDHSQIDRGPINATPANTSGDTSPSPNTITVDRAMVAPGGERLSNASDGTVRLQMNPNAVIIKSIEITTPIRTTGGETPVQDVLLTGQRTEPLSESNSAIINDSAPVMEQRLSVPQDISVPRQDVPTTHGPRVIPDQINRQPNVQEESPVSARSVALDKAPGMEQRISVPQDISVPRQDVPTTHDPRVIPDQINRQPNVQEELPVSARSVAIDKAPGMEQRISVPQDISVPRQNMPTTHDPRVIPDQINRQPNVQEELPVSARSVAIERAPGMEQRLSVPQDISVPRQDVVATHEPRVIPDQINRQQNVQGEIPISARSVALERAPGMEQRLSVPQDITVPRQDVLTTHEPRVIPDQINRQPNVQEEMPVSARSVALERAPGMEQRLSVPQDISVPRQDILATHEPRVISDQINSQPNVQEEIPVSARSEALERASGMEQRLSVPQDIIVPRQNMPETQRQPQTIHEPRVIPDQVSRQEGVQKIDEAQIPNATASPLEEIAFTGSTDAENYAGASGRSERAPADLRLNISGSRPETVRDIGGAESNNGTSVEHIQGGMGMQGKEREEGEAQSGSGPQRMEDQVGNMAEPRTPTFDGSQFLIPGADAELVPKNIEPGTGDLTANGETHTTSSLSELPDKMSMYVNSMETSNGSGSISIQLEPKHLGKIRFKVSIKDNKVSAELSVSLAQTKEILEAQLPEIRRSLMQHEMQVTELSVSLENESLESDLRHSNLFRNRGNGFKETHSSANYEQEEERESFEQRDARSNALVDLLI